MGNGNTDCMKCGTKLGKPQELYLCGVCVNLILERLRVARIELELGIIHTSHEVLMRINDSGARFLNA